MSINLIYLSLLAICIWMFNPAAAVVDYTCNYDVHMRYPQLTNFYNLKVTTPRFIHTLKVFDDFVQTYSESC